MRVCEDVAKLVLYFDLVKYLGHERSLTQIKYNKEGDLLFTCSKDSVINVWYSHNGERLGTYEGHNGSVWTVDVDCEFRLVHTCANSSIFMLIHIEILAPAQSRFIVTGAADNTMRLWNVSNGKCLFTWDFPTAVKRVAFSPDDSQIVCITEQRMGFVGAVRIFTLDRSSDSDGTRQSKLPTSEFNPPGSKATVCAFGYNASTVLTGHESGKIALWDAKTGEELKSLGRAHSDVITDLQISADRSYFITSSKDKTAKVGASTTTMINLSPPPR